MEDHIWDLLEIFISGAATKAEVDELVSLLGTNPKVLYDARQFLKEYNDPDPQVTVAARQNLISRAEKFADRQNATISLTEKFGRVSRMGRQLLKTTTRQIWHNKTISLINIGGLAMGMATAIVIFLWVFNQLTFNSFNPNRNRIYQVINQQKVNGKFQADGSSSSLLASVLKANYPQVVAVNRLSGVGSFVLKNGDRRFESQGVLTDANFFQLFNFSFKKGNPTSALNNTHNIVLSQALATKLFGQTDPMGKIVKIDSVANFIVTGILNPLPNNTQFDFEYAVPLSYMREVHWEHSDWNTSSVATFVMLKPGVTKEQAATMFKNVYRDLKIKPGTTAIVQSMADWMLYDKYDNGQFLPGRLNMVRWFAAIAVLVLLIACINYMNLGTARSAKRAKEVGVRKVAGAGRGILIQQFLGESVITAAAAGVLALILVELALPEFNNLIGNHLVVPYSNPVFWLTGIGFVFFTGIIAGSYPALYLSAFKPARVLKGMLSNGGTLLTPRKVLVVIQFTLAIAFILCTSVIYRQINFALHRSKGYDSGNLAYLYMKGDMAKNYVAIKQELENTGTVTGITRTNSPVIDIWTSSDNYSWQGKDPALKLSMNENFTDAGFTSTTGIQLLQGRDIDVYRYPTDTASVLLTETAAKQIGFKNPVGQLLKNGNSNLRVVGIIKDFVAGWAYNLPRPIIIRGTTEQFGAMNIRISRNKPLAENLAKISAIVQKYNPDYPFTCRFVDDTYAQSLKGDQNLGTIAAAFSGLTIFISCLGLFALAAFMAENRIKEIGIRKVLGASSLAVTRLLSTDFLILVAISFLIASPIGWWLMHQWLQSFPLRITISWWLFAAVGFACVLITLATVGLQAYRAAIRNPVKSLRSE